MPYAFIAIATLTALASAPLAQADPPLSKGVNCTVTIDGPRTSLDRLIHQADSLVYAAKQAGGDCVRYRHLHRGGTADIEPTSTVEANTHHPFANVAGYATTRGKP